MDDHWQLTVPVPGPVQVQVTVTGPEPALYSFGPGVKSSGGEYSTEILQVKFAGRAKQFPGYVMYSSTGNDNNSPQNNCRPTKKFMQ